jgi:hypothetical protein
MCLDEQLHHLLAAHGIKLARRLVGEHELRP